MIEKTVGDWAVAWARLHREEHSDSDAGEQSLRNRIRELLINPACVGWTTVMPLEVSEEELSLLNAVWQEEQQERITA